MEIEKIEIHHENQDIKVRHEVELEEILNNGKSSQTYACIGVVFVV